MEDQGGAGGAPLHGDGEEERRRRPHAAAPRPESGGTRAADTDEASRLDRPKNPGHSGKKGQDGQDGTTEWVGPEGT